MEATIHGIAGHSEASASYCRELSLPCRRKLFFGRPYAPRIRAISSPLVPGHSPACVTGNRFATLATQSRANGLSIWARNYDD